MKSFSERMGLSEPIAALQLNHMNTELRNSIWNVLDQYVWQRKNFLYSDRGPGRPGMILYVSRDIWADFFKIPADDRDDNPYNILLSIRNWYFKATWNEIYDFVEFLLMSQYLTNFGLADPLNNILERELSGFRIVESLCIPITNEQEIEAVEKAISATPYEGVRIHLKTALGHMSRREDPDYRGSIRESIHAVESLCQELTGENKATLGQALNMLERDGKIHGALKNGMSAFYGYASNEQGIRHAMLDEPNISADEAKFLLVSCSAFVNFMISKSS